MKYKIIDDGYYYVSAPVYKVTAIGDSKVVKNPTKSWWQFWKPKTVIHQEYKHEVVNEGIQVVYYKKGDVINHDNIPKRLHGITEILK